MNCILDERFRVKETCKKGECKCCGWSESVDRKRRDMIRAGGLKRVGGLKRLTIEKYKDGMDHRRE